MGKKAIIVVVVALAVLAVGLTWFLLPRQTIDPRLHLNVVRKTVEQGQPVFFFRVEGGTNRRIAISRLSRVTVENSNSWTLPSAHELDEFQGLVPPGPIHVPSTAREGFGVFVPTNAATWKLFVEVDTEDLSPADRFRKMPAFWKSMRKQGCSFCEATKVGWQSFFATGLQFVYSEPLTNSIPSSP
jgi:hypothetical protein